MTVAALSISDLAKLENGLKRIEGENLSKNLEASTDLGADDVETEFCTIWPKAEPILKLVAQYIGFIPGVGSTAAIIINGLVTAGDTMSSVVCPKS